jgi:hypothetical protein
MELQRAIGNYAPVPIPHHLMTGLLKDYVNPNNKIHQLIKHRILTRVTKGLYTAGEALGQEKSDPFLLANHILGPSYVSLESALSYYGLIPERVYTITSMTTKAARSYNTPMGAFTYVHLAVPYYSLGIRNILLARYQQVMIASPEKAMLDKIITTAGVTFRSRASVLSYLENDLRADMNNLRGLDMATMRTWLPYAPKRQTLATFIDTMATL